MLKRVSWFVSGAVAGIAGAGFAKRKVKQTAAQLTPTKMAKTAAAKVREKGHDVADAVRDGRDAMRAKESELRAKLAGDDRRTNELDDLDSLSGDPRLAATDRVIVIDQPVASVGPTDERGDERRGPRRHSRRRHIRRA
jgi:hypothetical protein